MKRIYKTHTARVKMFSASNCSFSGFLCFFLATLVLGDPSPDRKPVIDNILKGVSVTDTDDVLVKNVAVSVPEGADDHDILLNDPQTVLGPSNALYSLMTCNVGEWAVIHCDHFLRTFQANNDTDGMTVDIGKLEDRVTKVTVAIREVLNAALYYGDTSVLKPLMAIKFKCDLITSRKLLTDKSSPEAMAVFRGMQRDVRTVESYLLMNCGTVNVMDVQNDSPELDELTADLNEDSVALDKIVQLNIPKICTLSQVLLENLVSLASPEQYSVEILNANVKYSADPLDRLMTIKELLEVVPVSAYDVEVMFWYAKSVLPAIFSIIYCKVLALSPANVAGPITDKIGEIQAAIAQNATSYPPYFSDNFAFLNDKLASPADIKQRYESIDSVSIKCPAAAGPVSDAALVQKTSEELAALLGKISENIKDLTCYQKNFRFLHLDLDKTYNGRSARQVETILAPDEWTAGSANSCKFMADMYGFCHDAVAAVDGGAFADAWKKMDFVKTSFLSVVEIDYEDDLDLFETAVDVSIALASQNEPKDEVQGDYLRRTAYFAVAEIEEYGLRHCTKQPDFTYYPFNDVPFDRFTTAVPSEAVAGTGECFGPKFLQQQFAGGSEFLAPYAKTIRVLWRGNDESIGDVLKAATAVHVSPQYLHALYDVYFKYYLAVLFYEITVVSQYLGAGTQPPASLAADLKTLDFHACFPDQLWALIDDVNGLVAAGNAQDVIAQIAKNELSMFKIPPPTKNGTLDDAAKAFSTKMQGFVAEVKATVSAVNACYVKITRQKSDKPPVATFKSPRIFT